MQAPIQLQVFVYKYIAKTSNRSNILGKIHRQYSGFPQDNERLVIIRRLTQILQSNDPITDVNATLGS
jgi:hypothetical protein